MQKTILIILIAFSAIALKAQTNLDSLYTIWRDDSQPDSTRVTAYYDYIMNGFLYSDPDSAFILAKELIEYGTDHNFPKARAAGYKIQGNTWYMRNDNAKALDFYQRCLNIYEEIGDKEGIAASLGNLGNIYSSQDNYPKALDNFQRCLKIFEEIGNERGIASALINIGKIYYTRSNYPSALDYYQRSLKIFEEIRDNQLIATSLSYIGDIYVDMGNYPQALEYFQRSLKISEQMGNKQGISLSFNAIGNIYVAQGDYPQALDYFQRSLKISEEMGGKSGIAFTLNDIGTIYSEQANYPQALEYFQRSVVIKEEIDDKQGIAASRTQIGWVYKKMGMYPRAISECQMALNISGDLGLLYEKRDACSCLYGIYKATGNDNKALEFHEQMLVLDDSLNAGATNKKLQQMEFQKQMLADSLKQVDEKLRIQMANDEKLRKESRLRNLAIGAGVILLLVAAGFYSRARYIRKSKAILQTEKDRSDNLLLNILPAEIAEELKAKGRADARDFEMVSILFTDFKEFTQTSEKLSAKELVQEINTCFEAFDAICGKHGIEKIKTIGDAYMAAGGLPVPTDDSVKNTIHAALEMQAFITVRKSKMDAAGKPAFEMRVGIHTGPVVAGIVGVKKFQYDIWGDTVNTASRMESAGEVGKVNISEATYELLKDLPEFHFSPRGKIEVKGKGEMEMYFVQQTTDRSQLY